MISCSPMTQCMLENPWQARIIAPQGLLRLLGLVGCDILPMEWNVRSFEEDLV